MIEASFAQQYGIRLRNEDDMSWGEFSNLLCGLNEKTPLGNIIAIRSETDAKIIKEFTPAQKRIQSNWKNRNRKTADIKDYKKAMKNFEDMFIALSKT